MAEAVRRVTRTLWRDGVAETGIRAIPSEVAIAITYGGSTQAVMMATPSDLEDFAVGFSLTEGLIAKPSDIVSLKTVELEEGVELRMWLAPNLAETHSRRRRFLAGPTGCGLCGIESLAEAVKPPRTVSAGRPLPAREIMAAMDALPAAQIINQEVRAVHAAGFWVPGEGLAVLREDVGRHNALDKLCGALACAGRSGKNGVVIVTSRVSVEMVQKTAVIGAPIIAAVSAPTALAVRMADAAGITLVAIMRDGGFEVFTHPARIRGQAAAHVA